jgi:hypothetical protein
MATADAFHRLALALEGPTEAPHSDRTAFRVARTFATLAPDRATANLKLAPVAPVPNRWGAQGWTTVRLAALDPPDLAAALELAWRHTQPRARTKRRETTG